MSFKKYYKKRRRFRRGYGKSFQKAVSRAVYRISETKHHLTSCDFTNIGSISGSLLELTQIGRGTGDDQRIGDKINATKVFIQYLFNLPDNSSSDHIRVLVVRSKVGPLSTSDMPNFYSNVDIDKMYVLTDNMYSLYPSVTDSLDSTAGQAGGMVRFKRKFLFKKPIQVQYNDTDSNAVGCPIYIYMLSRNGYTKYAGFRQLYFKDM